MTFYDDPNREAVGLEPIWTGAGEEAAPLPGEGGTSSSSSSSFDPGEHTVEEVNDYLEKHPEDTERVLAAEEGGKGRVGVLGG